MLKRNGKMLKRSGHIIIISSHELNLRLILTLCFRYLSSCLLILRKAYQNHMHATYKLVDYTNNSQKILLSLSEKPQNCLLYH